MPLTQEQIDELLAGQLKPNRHGSYTPTPFEPPKQSGPIRFKNDRGTKQCQHITYTDSPKGISCGAPSTLEVQGKPYCILHAVIWCNQKLIEFGVSE